MSSQRFPNKMMYRVNNKPILEYVIERVQHAKKIDNIIVATSTNPSDDVIISYCKKNAINFYRGSLENVASRFFNIISVNPCEAFVRICGDRPLLDQELIDTAVRTFIHDKTDIITNVFPPTYPAGETVELIKSKVFLDNYPNFSKNEEFEHVTKFFYNNFNQFSIKNIESSKKYHEVHFAIDTQKDMQLFEEITAEMQKPHWEYPLNEIIQIYKHIRHVESI